MTRIYHQLGHRYQWSIESLLSEQTGDGAIIAPRYMTPAKVAALPASLRAQSIFDPQFFLPASTRGALPTYSFFPQVMAEGFSTTEWDGALADECARRCLGFQDDCGFESLVIPTRFRDGMPSDFVDSQQGSFVGPFMSAYARLGTTKPILLQLVLTDQMLKDRNYRRDLLNWITGIEDIAGVYLITHISNRRKQVTDIDFLLAMLSFIRSIKTAGMQVILGYLNTEAILLLASDPDAVTMGSYENLRMFGHCHTKTTTTTAKCEEGLTPESTSAVFFNGSRTTMLEPSPELSSTHRISLMIRRIVSRFSSQPTDGTSPNRTPICTISTLSRDRLGDWRRWTQGLEPTRSSQRC
jgi:hypothetical protein